MKGSNKGAFIGSFISAGSAPPYRRERSRSRSRSPPPSRRERSRPSDSRPSPPRPICLNNNNDNKGHGKGKTPGVRHVLPEQVKCRDPFCSSRQFEVFVTDPDHPEDAELFCIRCHTEMALDIETRMLYNGPAADGYRRIFGPFLGRQVN